ncbi:sigma-70 family RNA polymerase sigma factor [Cytobacillus oceanisediminis]|uniref:sigma-70 family RNA polymerase sigma factor n=1 Tax=Cytobacillus oceanisediminis TaxID=665099 RepID=UPI0037353A4A
MKWFKASDDQLQTIFEHEFDLPNHLLVGLVEEMLTRKIFDGMIVSTAKKLMGNFDRDEVLQAGYMAVYQAAKNYKKDISFKSMCFIAIEKRIITLLQVRYQKKNFMNQQALKNEVPIMADTSNVERVVIRKMLLQEQLSKLTEKQRDIITRFLDGYSLKWIGLNIYNQETSAIRYQFKKALQAMDIEGYEIGAQRRLRGA